MTFDCRRCGACCSGNRKDWVGCTESAARRLTGLVVHTPMSRHMKTVPERGAYRCAALAGKIGLRVTCMVYDSRPDVCRYVEPGSPDCLAARAASEVS